MEEISRFTCKSKVLSSFNKLLEHFQDNIIVLSYQSDGIPARDEITALLVNLKKEVKVSSRPHRYVLSSQPKEELLFITT